MHRQNQSDRTKTGLIVGIILTTIIAAAVVGWGLWQTTEYKREADNYARFYAEHANKQIGQSCLSVTAVNKQNCTAKASYEKRENERNERDLVAQRQSALWTLITGAAAIVGSGLSIVGVFLVWTTFSETRKANVIANEALDGQLRPWLSFKVNLFSVVAEAKDLATEVIFEIINHGPSPALYTTYTAVLYVENIPSERVFNLLPGLFEGDPLGRGRIIFSHEAWEPECKTVAVNAPIGSHPITLVLAVRYRSAYSPKHRYTCRIFDYTSIQRPDGMVEIRDVQERHVLRGEFVLRTDSGELAT